MSEDNSKVTKPTTKVVKPTAKVVKPSSKVNEAIAREHIKTDSVKSQSKPEKPKKNKFGKRGLTIILVVSLLTISVVGLLFFLKKEKERKEYEASLIVHIPQTSGYAVDCYLSKLNLFDVAGLSNGSVVSDCIVDDELLMVNNNELIEKFIKWVCSNVSVSEQDYSTKLVDSSCNAVYKFSIVDYASISGSLDAERISSIMTEYELSASDVDFSLRIQDIFCEYLFSLDEIPKVDVDVSIPLLRVDSVVDDSPYYYVIKDDKALDDVLFCSDDFHTLIDNFAKVAVGWTGTKTESYVEQEEQENPEYTEWLARLNAEIAKFPTWKNTSKCLYEPYYLRDENNKVVKDENGNKVVKFYVLFEPNEKGRKVKDSSSPYGYKYVPEPDHTIMVDVEKQRQVEDTWVEGSIFPYSWIGYWYVVDNNLPVRYGNGSKEYPLGLNTWCPTKLTLSDGSLVDARIELSASYIGADAVQYALGMSEKNRGLDSSSIVKLVICEFKITNTTVTAITFVPDMVLVDQYGNKLSRTGTLYGLNGEITLGAGESTVVVDWGTSTDIERYQVAWGKSFDVGTPMVFFDVIQSGSDASVVTDTY